MIERNISNIESSQFFYALNEMFERETLPDLTTDTELLKHAPLMKKWHNGLTLQPNDYFVRGVDRDGFLIVWQMIWPTALVVQSNVLPGGENSEHIYRKVGYINGYRIWVEPTSYLDSYYPKRHKPNDTEDWLVPKSTATTLEAIQYKQGVTALQGQVVIFDYGTPDVKAYEVIPKQIVMNREFVDPATTPEVYLPLDTTSITETSVTVGTIVWFKSKVLDNRWEPSVGHEVWDVVPAPIPLEE